MSNLSELNISLEPHLVEALEPLVALLPETLSSQLAAALKSVESGQKNTVAVSVVHPIPIVTYSLLSSISAWARTADGIAALRGRNPPLQSSDYSMVSLLAGTRTSPDRKFPQDPSTRNEAEPHDELADRRAITAVMNALLSILGSGAATWWAADKLAWRDEWVSLRELITVHGKLM